MTGPTKVTGPASGRAVLVGVDTYDFGVDGDLDGSAADAGRMAGLLLDAGMPADRIDLLVAAGKPQDHPVPARAVDGDGLYRYFNEELPGYQAGVLVVYWSGHGLEFDNQQWLCLPGASMANLQAVNLTGELLPVLAGSRYRFPEQYFFVDACRTRYDRVELPTGPIGRRFAPAGGGRHRQHALLAASSGAATANLPDRAAGAFSEALRAALARDQAWPWQLDRVMTRIARTTGLPPVQVTCTDPDGNRTSFRPGAEVSAIDVARLLARVPRMTDPDRIRRVALELEMGHERLRLGAVESPEELALTLYRSSYGLGPLLVLARTRPDYFPDVAAARNLILALEIHCVS